MAESNYYFREDVEAEKDRQAELNRQATLAPPSLDPAKQQADFSAQLARNQTAQTGAFADLGKAMAATAAAPKAPAAKPDYFADFRASLEAQNPFKQQLQGAVTETLKNPTAAFDAQASAERDRQAREASAAQEEARQASVLAYGGNQTGQVDRQMGILRDKNTIREAEFGRDVAAGRASAAEAARANAIQQGSALLGQEQQGAATAADIGLRQSGQQLEADLTREGFQVTKDEGKAERDIRKDLTMAQIGSAERMQLSNQVWQGTQNELDRSLEKLLSNDRIKASFTLAEMDAELQERMQATGFLNTKELEAMRGDLAERLQAKGFDHDTAMMIADQKYKEMEANRDRIHDEKMTDIKQRWSTGERLSTQEWDSTMRDLDRRHEDLLSLRQQAHERGMQTTEIDAMISENAKARASTEMMSAVQLAQQDKQFFAELQQRYQFNDQDIAIRTKEVEGHLGLMGLQGEQIKAAMANDKVKNASDILALGSMIGDGSDEAMAPFVEQFGAALEGYFKEQGIDISSSDFVKSLTAGDRKNQVTQSDTGAFGPGSTVAGIDLSKTTRPELVAALGDPAKLDQFIKSGAVKQISDLGSLTRMGSATQAFADAGLSERIASSNSNSITFKPQTYVYYNGKPYEVTKYDTSLTGTGTFGDKARNGYLRGIDLTTGKEVVIKRDREDI